MDCEGFFQGFDNPRSIPDPLNSNCGSDFKDVIFFVHTFFTFLEILHGISFSR